MTVPPLFGWQEIITALLLVIAAAVAFLVIAAVGAAASGRSEWRAWLDGRSRTGEIATDPARGTGEPPSRRDATRSPGPGGSDVPSHL
jgi:hypothetical protein